MSSDICGFASRTSTPRVPSSSSHFSSSTSPFFRLTFALSCVALRLRSAGKSGAIGEILTIRNAPFPPYEKLFVDTSCFFQPAGNVHEMPCWSHFTSCPFAMAAICAEVGAGFSTGSSPIFEGLLDDDEDELELLFVFSLLVRLHAATSRTKAIIASAFFIG